ncbi:subtilase-type protease inhibitor [Streptomyces sp. DSM 40750]|uniref:subtilase-type protease inhibitor n=1 Tax=Streptomyces sp. DSM 40750 TaxID=2801030 RepID=UPI00214C1FFD|nr:subtilase-type protease inhibitor [Streptomyces sp. DSM 40750]UUU23364.1 subtilase-type protease inhibitor [Streptomyces sp. DSM 40750]
MLQSPPALVPASPRQPVAPERSPAALGRLFLGVAASLAAAAAGTLSPVAPSAYAAEPLPRTALPTSAFGPGDRLTVTVREAGGGADGTFELRCHPDGGSHPDAREACGRLDRRTTWGKDPFAPVRPGTMCTMQYGGPATAYVTGTWAGRRVDARFGRGNGCEIARWDALVPVLPDLRA